MTHEQETAHAHDPQLTRSSRDREDAVPGQRSRAEQLVGPHPPTPSGIIQRKQRDDNGVADNADAAVAAATSSSGSPLPSGLMRKFESSLGADLSSVRVHTGDASADATHAAGARAYALGNDIHFAAGQYDPSSPSGEHLLAHEVAHTVQQSGSVGRRAQFKLDVSSPGDAHELEADRAADAMVTGAPAMVSTAAPAVQRDMVFPSDKLKSNIPSMKFPTDKIGNKDVAQKNKDVAAGANALRSRAVERILGQTLKTQAAVQAFVASSTSQIDAMENPVDKAWDLVEPMLELAEATLETFVPEVKVAAKVIGLFTKGFVAGYETGKVLKEKGADALKKDAKAAMESLVERATVAKEKAANVLSAPLDSYIAELQFGKDEAARKLLESHQPDDVGRLCDRIVVDPMKKSPFEHTLAGLGQKFAAWRVRSEFRAKHTKAEWMAIEADPNSGENKKLNADIADAELAARKDARKLAEEQKEPGTSEFPVW